jgi:hypothetical protein
MAAGRGIGVIAGEMAKAGIDRTGKEVFDRALKWRKGLKDAEAVSGIGGDCGRDGKGRDGRTSAGSP